VWRVSFTAGGQVDWWMRIGRVRVHGTNLGEQVFFAKYHTERAFNHNSQLTLEYRMNRLRPYVTASYARIKDRPGFEIDARARHTETSARAGAIIRLASKTEVDLAGGQTTYKFAGDAVFLGSYLGDVLNRKSTYGSGTVRYRLTPLTTVALTAETRQERFDRSPERDNNSFSLVPSVSFDPYALLKGSARVGYRRLDMLSPSLPDFQGIVAAVDLSYVLLGRTRLAVGVDRDVQYSYEITQPYYVITGVGGSTSVRLGLGWDLSARASTQQLAYRQLLGLTQSVAGRTDRVTSYGGGIGYRLSPVTVLSFNVDYYRRRSLVYRRDYETLRYGIGVTYGF
jgi:hypothetical protein